MGAVRVIRLAQVVARLVELGGVVQVGERQAEHRDATDQVAHPSTRVRPGSRSRVAPGQEPRRPPAHGGKDENCDPQRYDVPGSHHLGEEARLGEVDEVRGKIGSSRSCSLVWSAKATGGDEGEEASSHGQSDPPAPRPPAPRPTRRMSPGASGRGLPAGRAAGRRRSPSPLDDVEKGYARSAASRLSSTGGQLRDPVTTARRTRPAGALLRRRRLALPSPVERGSVSPTRVPSAAVLVNGKARVMRCARRTS